MDAKIDKECPNCGTVQVPREVTLCPDCGVGELVIPGETLKKPQPTPESRPTMSAGPTSVPPSRYDEGEDSLGGRANMVLGKRREGWKLVALMGYTHTGKTQLLLQIKNFYAGVGEDGIFANEQLGKEWDDLKQDSLERTVVNDIKVYRLPRNKLCFVDIPGENLDNLRKHILGQLKADPKESAWRDSFYTMRMLSLCDAYLWLLVFPRLFLTPGAEAVRLAAASEAGNGNGAGQAVNGGQKAAGELSVEENVLGQYSLIFQFLSYLKTPALSGLQAPSGVSSVADIMSEVDNYRPPDINQLSAAQPLSDPVFVGLTKADLYPWLTFSTRQIRDEIYSINPLKADPCKVWKHLDRGSWQDLLKSTRYIKVDWLSIARHVGDDLKDIDEKYTPLGLVSALRWLLQMLYNRPRWILPTEAYMGNPWNELLRRIVALKRV